MRHALRCTILDSQRSIVNKHLLILAAAMPRGTLQRTESITFTSESRSVPGDMKGQRSQPICPVFRTGQTDHCLNSFREQRSAPTSSVDRRSRYAASVSPTRRPSLHPATGRPAYVRARSAQKTSDSPHGRCPPRKHGNRSFGRTKNQQLTGDFLGRRDVSP